MESLEINLIFSLCIFLILWCNRTPWA